MFLVDLSRRRWLESQFIGWKPSALSRDRELSPRNIWMYAVCMWHQLTRMRLGTCVTQSAIRCGSAGVSLEAGGQWGWKLARCRGCHFVAVTRLKGRGSDGNRWGDHVPRRQSQLPAIPVIFGPRRDSSSGQLRASAQWTFSWWRRNPFTHKKRFHLIVLLRLSVL